YWRAVNAVHKSAESPEAGSGGTTYWGESRRCATGQQPSAPSPSANLVGVRRGICAGWSIRPRCRRRSTGPHSAQFRHTWGLDRMLATGERPRELRWYHAGPMLFGDWGTSRLYVLGLAFAFTGRASFWFIAGMCALMIGVGWSYEIICRLFPNGGGVYSSARHRSQLLAAIGGLPLCADYVRTASRAFLVGFHSR